MRKGGRFRQVRRMKIEDKRLLTTTFEKIEIGECFIDEDEDLYLKIETVYLMDERYNSVDVLTGRVYHKLDIEAVEAVRTRVVIE